MVSLDDRAHRLDKALIAAGARWDICLIDCPPSLGLLTVNALVAARNVVVPLQCEFFALEGLSQLLQTVERIRSAFNPELSILGVALTMFDRLTSFAGRRGRRTGVSGSGRLRHGRTAQRAAVRSAKPRTARVDLRPEMPWIGGLCAVGPRTDLQASASGGGGMSSDRPGKGLGMGLSALLGDSQRSQPGDASHGGGVREIEIARIRPNPNQPRVQFREETIDELATIAERGVLQPILLRPTGDGFEIVAGERRWRAAQGRGSTPFPPLSATSTKVRWRSLR